MQPFLFDRKLFERLFECMTRKQAMKPETHPKADAVILLGRGGYGSVAQPYPQELSLRVAAAVSTDSVMAPQILMAYIDQGEPSLPAALDSCIEAGARCILIQPVYLPVDRNLHRWIGKVIMRWHAGQEGHPVEVLLGEPLGEQPEFGAALGALVQNAPNRAYNVVGDPPEKWEQDPAGWSKIPDHRYHIFWCRGPRCTALGADRLAHHLREQLKAHKLLQDDRVLMAQSGCLYPCNLGPVLVVYPDGVWYGGLDEAIIDRIVEEHFCAHQIVQEAVIYGPATS